MPILQSALSIKAPAALCFDLSRSIDLHLISTKHTGEEAIAGTTKGLIGLGESVTWRAKHLGIWQTLTTRITEFNSPHFFVDEMVSGAFHSFRHEHHFKETDGVTCVIDIFNYRSPLGHLGKLADWLFLTRYMERLLKERNRVIKEYAETGKWQDIL